jgi:exopolyphosphatase/pppGpp-phosphohydrolase
VAEDRVVLGLGAEIERTGRISKASLATTRASVAGLCSQAEEAGCAAVEVLVTSPCRQPGGVLILDEIQRLLASPLLVAAGGLREGAALTLLERADRAA